MMTWVKNSAWAMTVICGCMSQAYADEQETSASLCVLVTEGTSNKLTETRDNTFDRASSIQCAVIVRRSPSTSLVLPPADVNKSPFAMKKKAERQFKFIRSSPLNFAVVNCGDAFVLSFLAVEKVLPMSGTLNGVPQLNRRVVGGMAKAGFSCPTTNGVHDIVCLNTENQVIGHVMGVRDSAEEYAVVASGKKIELKTGRLDIAVWLGERWHPMRFSGPFRHDLNLHFQIRGKGFGSEKASPGSD